MTSASVNPPDRPWKFALPLLLLAPLLWGGNFFVGRIVGPEIPAHWLNIGRWSIAALCLMPFGLLALWRERQALWHARGRLAILALLGVVGFNTVLYAALQSVTASQAAVIFAATPLLIMLLAALHEWRRPEGRLLLAAAVSILGVWLIQGLPGSGSGRTGGRLLVFCAALIWALYCIAIKRLAVPATPVASFLAQILIGLAVQVPLTVVILGVAPPPAPTPEDWLAIGYLGVFAAAVAFLAWQVALRAVQAGVAGLFMNLVPLSSLALSWIFLGEALSGRQMLGAGLIFGSVAFAQVHALGLLAPRRVSQSGHE